MLVLGATVFAYQEADVGNEVVCFVVLDVLAVLHLGVVPFFVASYAHHFALVLSFQGLNYFFGIESCADYFRLE